jgi:hypothetical protein
MRAGATVIPRTQRSSQFIFTALFAGQVRIPPQVVVVEKLASPKSRFSVTVAATANGRSPYPGRGPDHDLRARERINLEEGAKEHPQKRQCQGPSDGESSTPR